MTLPSSALMRAQAALSCWTACRSDGLAESGATGSAGVFDAVVFIQLFRYWPPPYVGGYNSCPLHWALPAPLLTRGYKVEHFTQLPAKWRHLSAADNLQCLPPGNCGKLAPLRQFPGVAVGHVQPFGFPGAGRKLIGPGVPLKLLAVIISEIDQVADRNRARPNFDVANR